jgi:hypothetical protein
MHPFKWRDERLKALRDGRDPDLVFASRGMKAESLTHILSPHRHAHHGKLNSSASSADPASECDMDACANITVSGVTAEFFHTQKMRES